VDSGVGTHVLMEEGLARANGTVVGTDSHMNILGAIGVFGQGMGDVDITFAFRTGRTWFEVPESIRVILKGTFKKPTSAKDLTLFLLKVLGTKRIALRSAEFTGPSTAGLSLSGRLTLCSMVTEMAGIIGSSRNSARKPGKKSTVYMKTPDSPFPLTGCCLRRDNRGRCPGSSASGRRTSFPNQRQARRGAAGHKDRLGIRRLLYQRTVRGFRRGGPVAQGTESEERNHAQNCAGDAPGYEELLAKGILQDLFEAGAIVVNPGCGAAPRAMSD